jgi:hypothetical protein
MAVRYQQRVGRDRIARLAHRASLPALQMQRLDQKTFLS